MDSATAGKVALVTGATSGIGRATAIAFAKQGVRVVAVADRNVEGGRQTVELVERAGSEGIFVRCNVSRRDQVEALVSEAVRAFGRIDYACNSAGVVQPAVPMAEIDEGQWDRIVDVNLKGVFLCMKYELRQMLKQGGGAIVNIASIGGLVAPSPGLSAYIASKHGVVGLTKAAAIEYAVEGIRVNAVCPAVVETEMTAQFAASSSEEVLQFIRDIHPMGRFGKPEEVAGAVMWLCSDSAAFVTGASVAVDGGVTAR